jgi:hypothetical protein
MKTREWIWLSVFVTVVIWAIYILSGERALDDNRQAETARAVEYARFEEKLIRERKEFEEMDADQKSRELDRWRLERLRQKVVDARTPGEVAAAQAEYEQALAR